MTEKLLNLCIRTLQQTNVDWIYLLIFLYCYHQTGCVL